MITAGTIKVNQTLHGYDNGHRLLRSSQVLPPNVQREMLSLSDLAARNPTSNFDSYLTVYPLSNSSLYAWSRTWLAPEMKRPGCVWTHTLLVEFGDLASFEQLNQLYVLLELLRRPVTKGDTIQDGISYETPYKLRLPHPHSQDSISISPLRAWSSNLEWHLLASLYQQPVVPIFLLSSDAAMFEPLILSIWLQQWPRLRRQFAFCTGVTSNRKRGDTSFDLQVAPLSAAAALQREVPEAIILDGVNSSTGTIIQGRISDKSINVEEVSEDISWLDVAVNDLSSKKVASVPSLRDFFRHYGADASADRSEYAVLGNIFAWLEKVNVRENTLWALMQLLEVVGEAFPHAKQAKSLKINIFGRPAPNDLLKVGDTEVLHALAITPYYEIFDIDSLNITARVEALWQKNRGNAEALLLDVAQYGSNPFVEDIVSAVAYNVTPHEALALFRRNPSLGTAFVQRNQTLGTSSTLWQGSVDLQRELFDTLVTSTLSDSEQQLITVAVFNAGAEVLVGEVKQRFGIVAAKSILEELENSPRQVPSAWHSILTAYPDVLGCWLRSRICSDSVSDVECLQVIAPLLILISPKAHELREVAPYHWTRFAGRVMSLKPLNQNEQRLQTDVCAFVLAVGLASNDKDAGMMIERTFQPMHDVLKQDRQSFDAWKWLEGVVPSLDYKNWDKCERLRLATIERWVENDWPVSQFINCITDDETLNRVLLSCQQTVQGEQFFRHIRKRVAAGSLSVPSWQKPLWMKKKKLIRAFFDHLKK